MNGIQEINYMTMIPPKIKKLPNLHKSVAYKKTPTASSMHSNRSLYMGGAKMVR